MDRGPERRKGLSPLDPGSKGPEGKNTCEHRFLTFTGPACVRNTGNIRIRKGAVRCWVYDRGDRAGEIAKGEPINWESGVPRGQYRSAQTWRCIHYIFVFFRSAAFEHLTLCGDSAHDAFLNIPP